MSAYDPDRIRRLRAGDPQELKRANAHYRALLAAAKDAKDVKRADAHRKAIDAARRDAAAMRAGGGGGGASSQRGCALFTGVALLATAAPVLALLGDLVAAITGGAA